MLDYFQPNKSQRATCKRCQQVILDKMRGVKEVSGFGHKEYHYYCIECSGNLIQETKKELQSIEQTLKYQMKNLTEV